MKPYSFFKFPHVLAHRGASAYAPENTLAAIYKAIEQQCTWVEVDIGLTKCGEMVVQHDEDLFRITGMRAKVHTLDYQQISTLDAGSWFADKYAGERIPTLADLLNIVKQTGIGINIEIKPYANLDDKLAKNILQTINKLAKDYQSHLLISSFSLNALQTVRSLDKNIALAWLTPDRLPKNWINIVDELTISSVNLDDRITDATKIKLIKQHTPYVLVYTVDDAVRAQQLYQMGVDGIFTNMPDKILTVAKKYFAI